MSPYSPQSNATAEAIIKSFKRDYVRLNRQDKHGIGVRAA